YTITVNNQNYVVKVAEGGDITQVSTAPAAPVAASAPAPVAAATGETMNAPLAGNIWKINAKAGEQVQEGDVLLTLEAMKMETEIRAPHDGVVSSIDVSEGDAVQVGDALLVLA
ncbi:biotin/lipoyl-binding protein, partial [Vibrio tritonius]